MAKQIELKNLSIGNFAADLVLEPSEAVYDYFAQAGAKAYFSAKPVNEWEKKEATRLGLWPVNANGVATRPKTYKRESLPFSSESAENLKKQFDLATVPINGKAVETGLMDSTINENSDYTGTIAFLEQWLATPNKADGSARTIEQFAGKIGVTVPSEPWQDEAGFLAQVKVWHQEQIELLTA